MPARMKPLRFLTFLVLAIVSPALAEDFLPGVKRVLFLGDSITYAGHYTELFDAFLFTQFPDRHIEVIDCGLPSETVSGLSEAGHAGGKFPRPDVHERLDRVLATVKPDLVFACYGMNCGIYLPLDDKRFTAYQSGIRKLREKVEKAGAKIIHLTPPVFDTLPIAARTKSADVVKDGEFFEGYNGVLDRYSAWLVEQGKKEGWRVIDTHSAMAAALAGKRETDPGFFYAKDGVHANNDGHRVIAEAILTALAPEKSAAFLKLLDGDWAKSTQGRAFFDDIHKRNRLLCDSYLTTAGHLRPGMAKGLPVAEAEEKAAPLEVKIREAAKGAK
jgi:lysophospholipase L1-like esterase